MMKIIKGKFDTAKVFTENIDDATMEQIKSFLDQQFVTGANVRIMPDCHAGKGAVIGTTMKIKNKIVPNLVGVDIGCGMLCMEIQKSDIDFEKLDRVIRVLVPAGQGTRQTPHSFTSNIKLSNVIAPFSLDTATLSLGTLGGGNHFIEVNHTDDGRLFLVIHSGSRHLGAKVARFHQKRAIDTLKFNREELNEIIANLKKEGKQNEIQKAIQSFKTKEVVVPAELSYLEGLQMEEYFHDLKIAQDYAKWNRAAMAQVISENMNFVEVGRIDTVHNYVDLDNMILRKGAISAQKGELVLIPINMRDGSLLAEGKGNEDWNYSGPHGAGRIFSRTKAKATLNMEDFKETMKDVFTTSVDIDTIDESPFAYKTMNEIIENTKDTIEVKQILKPIYNFKSSEYIGYKK